MSPKRDKGKRGLDASPEQARKKSATITPPGVLPVFTNPATLPPTIAVAVAAAAANAIAPVEGVSPSRVPPSHLGSSLPSSPAAYSFPVGYASATTSPVNPSSPVNPAVHAASVPSSAPTSRPISPQLPAPRPTQRPSNTIFNVTRAAKIHVHNQQRPSSSLPHTSFPASFFDPEQGNRDLLGDPKRVNWMDRRNAVEIALNIERDSLNDLLAGIRDQRAELISEEAELIRRILDGTDNSIPLASGSHTPLDIPPTLPSILPEQITYDEVSEAEISADSDEEDLPRHHPVTVFEEEDTPSDQDGLTSEDSDSDSDGGSIDLQAECALAFETAAALD